MDQPWQTGFYKEQVDGPRWLAQTNLAGDGQADLVNHGGPDKAVLAYASEHYPSWRERLQKPDFPHGAFGENFTVDGPTEDSVNIGDIYRLGGALVQVSQPRQPCWKLGHRFGIATVPATVVTTRRSGWYYRVIEEGSVAAGDALALVERPLPEWSVERVFHLLIGGAGKREPDALRALAAMDALATSWRARAEKLLG